MYTKLDLRKGFNLVRMQLGDEEKVAFITCQGLYKPLVMQFGLCNAPPTFQQMIDNVLAKELEMGRVLAYMDDILIAMET